MLRVAITGNIASGKSTVEDILQKKGYNVLDTDTITHELLFDEKVKKEIIQLFQGFNILEAGEISRPKLGKVVFENTNLRKKLEKIIHPLIKHEIGQFFQLLEQQKDNKKIAFVAVPLLYEAKFENLFDRIILIYADDEIRKQRLINDRGMESSEIENRLKSQISQDEKKSLVDFVIYNNQNLENLYLSINALEKNLLK